MKDFERIYRHPLSSGCTEWEKSDSHCCKMGRLLKGFDENTDLVSLPIMKSEYSYLEETVDKKHFWPEKPSLHNFSIDGYPIALYLQPCNFGGLCNPDIRPLICRIYPYIPYIEQDFTVTRIINAALVDLFWGQLPEEDPCALRTPQLTKKYLSELTDLIGQLKDQKDNHEFFLWLNIAYIYLESFKAYVIRNIPQNENHLDFFKVLYLCQKSQLFLAEDSFKDRLKQEISFFRKRL